MEITKEEIKQNDVLSEVVEGLSKKQKTLPSKYFYDEKGSKLFDEICELEEYYPTRTEMKIMEDNIKEIGELLGEGTLLIELGSGSSKKIRLLLEYIPGLAGYIPVDISEEHLEKSAQELKSDYSELDIFPVVADYTKQFDLPDIKKDYDHRAVYYPGSTIGNFEKNKAKEFLGRIAKLCGKNGGLVIGVDLKKERDILEKAYNDKKGITAKFNLNILDNINRQINSNFDKEKFYHYAYFNERESRIEMHLVSKVDHEIRAGDKSFTIKRGENILTEYSYKYTLDDFAGLASDVFVVKKVWTDDNELFSIQYFKVK